MSQALRILIVEDAIIAAEAIMREIRQSLQTAEMGVAADRAGLAAALDGGSWDAVVCDYVLKDFNGSEALMMCKDRGLDIPFICVSGEIDGEQAAEIVRQGAHDFVSKSHLDKLLPVLLREIERAEVRRHRRKVESFTTHLAAIVEGTDDAIFSRDMRGTILTWNSAAEAMYGYTAEEAIGRDVSFIVPPDRTGELVDILGKLEKGERIARMETERVRKDGSRLQVSMTISPLRNEAGRVIGASIIARDITARHQMEQERLALIAELQAALSKVKMLSGLLPICAGCKRIRDEKGRWQAVEVYVHEHSQADFTHGICPECARELYPDLSRRVRSAAVTTTDS
jgi:two-component system cell cycle sensor histidine kinase/response regulator CckA